MLKLYLKYCLLWILRTTLLLFLPAFFTITANAQGWNWLNPTITGDDLIDVQFLDECTGFALGERGTVLKTLNSGKDWFEIYSDPQFNISAFYGVDSDDLWLLGFHRPMVPPWVSALQLRRSTDGGKNWQVMFQSDSSEGGQYFNYGLHDIYFINSSIGWAVGDSGLVLKTEDSGQSWSGTFIPTEYSLHQIVALNASQAYASGGEFYISFTGSDTSFSWGELHKTEDGGSSWTTVYQDSIYFEDIFFLDNFNAHATGSKITVPYIGTERLEHYILKSTDGGINWGESIITGGIGYSWPTDIYFPTQQIGFATGYGGSTFRTFNGGNTWEPMSILGRNIHRLHRIDFADEMSGVIVGEDGAVIKTADGGLNWDQIDEKPINSIASPPMGIEFTSIDTGWVAGGTLYHTIDAGEHWLQTGLNGIHDVDFVDKNNGWAVGRNGQIWNTSNAGQSWVQQQTSTTSVLRAVEFYDKNIGWTVGQNVILNTLNGGQSWNIQASGYNAWRILIRDSLEVWVHSYGTSPLHTTNGGQNWKVDNDIHPTFFLNNNIGWGRQASAFYQTIDGGDNWLPRGIIRGPIHQNFVDSLNGWSISLTAAFSTNDGGTTWKPFLDTELDHLWDILMLDNEHGWIVGNGILLRYGYPEYTEPPNSICNPLGINRITFPTSANQTFVELYQNYPNPFNSSTLISFELYKPGQASLVLYDILGKEVTKIELGYLSSGFHQTNWDGKDKNGNTLSSGIYYYRLRISEGISMQRSILKKLLIVK